MVLPPLVWEFCLVLAGFALLIVGGDKLVEGASGIARRFNVSEMLIGIAIVGFGTSMPEMMATISAMRTGSPEIALGNILGSNIANVGLILGVALLMTSSAAGLRKNRKDYGLMLLALVLFSALFWFDMLHFWGGVILLAALGVYLAVSIWLAGDNVVAIADESDLPLNKAVIFVLLGLIGLVVGADWLISGAVVIAYSVGISERIVGITLIAVGSSLPELSAAIAAARQNKLALTVGNILGSNAFNVLAAGGASALLGVLPVAPFKVDILVMLGFAALLLPLFFLTRRPYKLLGSVLLGGYAGYIWFFVI